MSEEANQQVEILGRLLAESARLTKEIYERSAEAEMVPTPPISMSPQERLEQYGFMQLEPKEELDAFSPATLSAENMAILRADMSALRQAQEELRAQSVVKLKKTACDLGIYGGLARFKIGASSQRKVAAPLLWTEYGLELDRKVWENVSRFVPDKTKTLVPIPGPFLSSSSVYWQHLHGSSECPWTALVALTPCFLSVCPNKAEDREAWDELTFQDKWRASKQGKASYELDHVVSSLLMKQEDTSVCAVELEPGNIILTHRGMPIMLRPAAAGQEYIVKTLAFLPVHSQGKRKQTLENALETGYFAPETFRENVFFKLLPMVKEEPKKIIRTFPRERVAAELSWFTMGSSSSDDDDNKKPKAKETVAEVLAKYDALMARINAINPRAWNPTDAKHVFNNWQKITSLEESGGKAKGKYLKALNVTMGSLEPKIAQAQKLEEEKLADFEDRLSQFGKVLEEMPEIGQDQKGNRGNMDRFLREHKKFVDQPQNTLKYLDDLTKLLDQATKLKTKLESGTKSKRPSKKRASPGSSPQAVVAPFIVPTVDQALLEPLVIDRQQALEYMRTQPSQISGWGTSVAAMDNPEALALYENLQSAFTDFKKRFMEIRKTMGDDALEIDASIYMAHYNAVKDMLEQYANRGSLSSSSSMSSKMITCPECERRNVIDFEGQGFCKTCFRGEIFADRYLAPMDARLEKLSRLVSNKKLSAEERAKYKADMDRYDETNPEKFAKDCDSFINTGSKEKWAKIQTQLLVLDKILPILSPEEMGEDDDYEDEDEESSDDNDFIDDSPIDQPLSPSVLSLRNLPDDEDEASMTSSSSDEEEEDLRPRKNGKKRSREDREEVDSSGIAHETLMVCHGLPVHKIHKELISLYAAGPPQRPVLEARLQALRSNTTKYYGILIENDCPDEEMDPYEHDVYYLSPMEAKKAKLQLTVKGETKATMVTKEVTF